MKHWKKWAQHGAALGIGLWAFACSDGGKTTTTTGASGGNGGVGGTGGAAEASSSSSSVASSGSGSMASSSGGGMAGAGGSMGFVCDPPAEPGSLYEHAAESYDINDFEPVSMCKYRGKVLLIVNTAAA